MKPFWWFEENAIAGMARPGFNCTRWFDFPFEEGVLMGWLGQHGSGATSLAEFRAHVPEYGSKIARFYALDVPTALKRLQVFDDRAGLLSMLESVTESSELLESFEVSDTELRFSFSRKRLQWEIERLKRHGITRLVSLTERHNDGETLREHFDAHHFPIVDLDAPETDQALQLAELIRQTRERGERIAVHCLAGIGRTSTMLIAAHLALGESLERMMSHIAVKKPEFVLVGPQAQFIHSFAEKIRSRTAPDSSRSRLS